MVPEKTMDGKGYIKNVGRHRKENAPPSIRNHPRISI